MLSINSLPATGEVAVLILSNGAEVIGEMVSNDSDYITLKRPLILGSNGQGGIGLMPATMMGDPENSISYRRGAVMGWPLRLSEEVVKAYRSHTSGIAIAQANAVPTGRI